MTTNEMLTEIYENLKSEILADEAQADKFSEPLLHSKVNGAFREVKKARRYPHTYSESQIEYDILDYYSNIESLARYDYNKIGAEGLESYSADSTTIHYDDRNKYFYGVYPVSRHF